MSARRIDIGGIELAAVEAGAGGRPLLIAHGFTGSKESFAHHADALAGDGWHVVIPDHRGHGESDKPEGLDHYSGDVFADDLLRLADALGFEQFALLGHSMGGMIAQVVALRVPERVTALVLMDTHHAGLTTLDPNLVELGYAVALEHGMDVVADAMRDMGEGGPLHTEAHERLMRERPDLDAQADAILRGVSPYMYAALLKEIASRPDHLDRLAGLSVPTLVVVGEQDAPFRKASERMAAAIPGAQLAVIPDGGHSPQLEAPDAWLAAVQGFLRSVVAGADAGQPPAVAGR